MNRFYWLVIFCFCASTLFAQRYKQKHIRKDLHQLDGFQDAFVGFALYDPEKDKMLVSDYADKHMTPASNTKLFTFWAAQQYLPETLSALEYIVQGDSLIFWSTGYPLTLHPDQRDSTIIDFLSSQDKQLFYWPRPIADDRFGPGWGWDDFGGYYGAEKSVFPIYGNSAEFIINNDQNTYRLTPEYPGFQVNVSSEVSNRSRVSRDEFWNEFELKYDEAPDPDAPIDTLIRPFRYSDQLFVELLSRATSKEIIKLESFQRPNSYQSIEGVHSDSLYKWMLQPSDNLFAESMLLMSSGTFSDTLSTESTIEMAQLTQSLTSSPIFKEELIWVDGSGLSRYNMFKPSEIVGVLEALYDQSSLERLFELLPQGGVSGTIEDWYGSENGEPYVFAKTGTLSNNHTLSGYIKTKKGKTLIFTIMANHYTCSTNQVRENFEIILNKIRNGY